MKKLSFSLKLDFRYIRKNIHVGNLEGYNLDPKVGIDNTHHMADFLWKNCLFSANSSSNISAKIFILKAQKPKI